MRIGVIFYMKFITVIVLIMININTMEPCLEHFKAQFQVYSMFCSAALYTDIPPMTVTHSSCLCMKPVFLIYISLGKNYP